MSENYWDKLMETDEGAAIYMDGYGEGVGAKTRDELSAFINDEESVLDVGCGPGWNYDHFEKFGPKVRIYAGLDYSERFIRIARQRQPNAIFDVGDARKLQALDNTWDVVILMDCLEHTSGYEQPIAEALRVANKRIIVTFWHMIEDDLQERVNIDGDDGFGYWYSRPRWERFLEWQKISWFHHQFEWPKGRVRDFYIIDKEEPK